VGLLISAYAPVKHLVSATQVDDLGFHMPTAGRRVILLHDRLLSHVALRYAFTDSQRNLRPANRSGRSILTRVSWGSDGGRTCRGHWRGALSRCSPSTFVAPPPPQAL